MHSRPRVGTLRLFVFAFVLATPALGWAHAILVESTPAAHASVKGPEVSLSLRFNVRIDAERSRLRLVATDGTANPLTIEKQPSPDRLQSHATGLAPGTYRLQWQVLASDGHMSRGEIPFTVK